MAARSAPSSSQIAGLAVENVSDSLKAEWDISGGVVINSITSRRAQAAGMRVGDVILQIAGREIEDVSSFRDIVEELGPWSGTGVTGA